MDTIIKEIRKCILLCSNCHRCYHAGIIKIPENIQRFNEKYADYRSLKQTYKFDKCPICNGDKELHNKTCSLKCAAKIRYPEERWLTFDLEKMYNEFGNYTQIAEIIGVSDGAIIKRMKN